MLVRLLFAAILFVASSAWAGSVALLLSSDERPYQEFATSLADVLDGTPCRLFAPRIVGGDLPDEHPDLVVAVGGDALRAALRRYPTTPVLAALLPRRNFERIAAEANRPLNRLSAIYLDQPPGRQAAFIRQLQLGTKHIGLLASNETRPALAPLRRGLADGGLALETEDVDGDAALLPALNALLPRVGVLLALPDSSIYRRENIKAILMTAFRHQKPVIGYSAAFVNAGGVAALYSTPAQIAAQAAEAILIHGTSLPPPAPPAKFAIVVNKNVANALGLRVPDETAIRQGMLGDREP